MNRKTSWLILILILFLLVLVFYIRKRGEERIIPGVEAVSGEKNLEQTGVKKIGASQTSPDSTQTGNIPSPEKTPDPFADLETSTPVLAMLYGKVTDREGQPLPGVQVSLNSKEFSTYNLEIFASCFTNEQGNYKFDSLPVSYFRVMATKPGYYLEYEQVSFSIWTLSIEQNFEMLQGGLSLAGIVQDKEGSPVSQASIILHLHESNLFPSQTTNIKGVFRFDGLWKEMAALSITATGYTAFSERPVIIGKEDLRIVLSSGGGTKIKGTVLYNDTREPAPGSAITIEQKIERFLRSYSIFFTAKTDEWGVYETVSLPPGKYILLASKDGCNGESRMTKEIHILEGAREEMWMDLMLPRMHDIRGCVIDAKDHQPIPGAIVQARSIPPETVQTDSQGRFCIPDSRGSLFQNAVSLFAQAPGYMPGIQNIRYTSPKSPPVIIKMRKGVHIYGTISSSSGEPATNADWEIQKANLQIQTLRHSHHTDSQGRYEDVVMPEWIGEEVCVYAYSPKYGYGMDAFQIPEQGMDIKRDITLSPGISVTVWVLDRNGEGIKDYEINARTPEKGGNGLPCSLRTDIEGCAVFKNLPQSLFEFSAHDPLNDPYKQNILNTTLDLASVAGPQEIVFSLDNPEETLRVCYGSVMDDQGNPLKDVLVESFSLRKETLTDTEGGYRIETISSEEKREPEINFSKTGYFVSGRSFNPLEKEDRLDVVMKKQDSQVFFGTIKSSSGEIPTEAEIEVWQKNEGNAHHHLAFKRVSLMQGGAFKFNISTERDMELSPFSTTIDFNPDNTGISGIWYYIKAQDYVHGSGRSQDIKAVGGGSIGPFDINLSWGKLKGYLRDGKTGNAVSNGLISSFELSSWNFDFIETKIWGSGTYTHSDQTGYFELSPLPPGCSEIYIYHPEYWIQEKTAPEITRENLEVEWNPVLDPCSSLEGRVFDSEGTALGLVEICINNQYDFTRSLETDDQGRYSFTGIPPGEYSLSYFNSNDNCSLVIKRDNVSFSEPEKRFLDIHVPKLVPALVQLINMEDKTQNQKVLILKPLYPAEFNSIDIYLYVMDPHHTYRMLLPSGRHLMHLEGNEATSREIEIHPTRENRIIIEDEK